MALDKYGGAASTSKVIPRLGTPGPFDVPQWGVDDDYKWDFDRLMYGSEPRQSSGFVDMNRLGLADITKTSFAPQPKETEVQDLFAGKQLAASGSTKGMNESFSAALARANAAMKAAGLGTFGVVSGFRSREQQQRLYDAYINGTGNLAAKPGNSRHEHGTAVDINWSKLNPQQQAWLRANLPKFGIINTGMSFSQKEPWHWEWRG